MVVIQMSRKSVTEQVLEYLKEQIRVGRWTYGEKIDSENQLTYELQVSRASVRHAIQQLVALGVLESFQGKGTFVKTLPEDVMMSRLGNIYLNQDLHTLAEFRNIVESAACRKATDRIAQETLEKMEPLAQYMEQGGITAEEFERADAEFHNCILNASGNHMIVESMKSVAGEIRKQHFAFHTFQTMKRAAEYHRWILEAMKSKNRELAAELMSQHLTIVEEEIYKKQE